jgi:uncharacterized protein (DUF488 family)
MPTNLTGKQVATTGSGCPAARWRFHPVLPTLGWLPGGGKSINPIHTIGHSTRGTDELIDLLRASDIDLVVDVRSYPRSRRHPQFNIETLPPVLVAAGIGYRHIEALGGRRPASLPPERSPNQAWREPAFRHYADYALGPQFRVGLDTLLAEADLHRPAIMCAEAVWWQCHRRIITDYLLVRGRAVQHIMGPGQIQEATLTPGAVTRADGTVRYPPPQGSLL